MISPIQACAMVNYAMTLACCTGVHGSTYLYIVYRIRITLKL